VRLNGFALGANLIPPSLIKLGWSIWTTFKPWRRLKSARNKRRARLGKPLLLIDEGDDNMFPKGTQTYTGIAVLILTPLAARYGFASEEVSLWVTAVGTVVGGLIAVFGRLRAGKTPA